MLRSACTDASEEAAHRVSPECRMPLDREILYLTNELRAEHSLPPLAWHEDLSAIAARHAAAIADGCAPWSHHGAHDRFAACSSRCVNVAENLARSEGYSREDLPQVAMRGWRESQGHFRNLVGPFDVCGVGWAANSSGTIFITQLLGLLDEESKRLATARQWRDQALGIASSTPSVLATLGFVLAGPPLALGGGVLGGVLDRKYGVKVSSLPRVVAAKVAGLMRRSACSECGAPPEDGGLLICSGGSLMCARCHPEPLGADVWCYLE